MFIDHLLDNGPNLVAIVLLTCAAAFLSAGETALFALSRQQLAQLRQSSHLAAKTILQLRERPADTLSTVLLGNITVNVVLYSILAFTCSDLGRGSPGLSTALGFGGFAIVVLVGEFLPKLFAFVAADHLAPLVVLPLRVLQVVSSPLRSVITHGIIEPLSRIVSPHPRQSAELESEELRQLVGISHDQHLIDERENAMLHQLMDLADARVASLMVPRVDVVAFDLAEPREQLVELIRESRLLRIPVYDESIDNVRGIILAKEFLLSPDRPLLDLIRPVRFIPEQASVEALLQHFRATASQMALVVDEYGGLAGVVAMEDVVEEIVGELYAPDEPHQTGPIRRMDEKTFMVDADLDIDDFCRAFQLTLEESRFNTVGGLIAAELNRVPGRGDQVSVGPASLTVVSMRRRRVLKARLELPVPPEETADLERLLAAPADEHSGAAAGGAT